MGLAAIHGVLRGSSIPLDLYKGRLCLAASWRELFTHSHILRLDLQRRTLGLIRVYRVYISGSLYLRISTQGGVLGSRLSVLG